MPKPCKYNKADSSWLIYYKKSSILFQSDFNALGLKWRMLSVVLKIASTGAIFGCPEKYFIQMMETQIN